MDNCCICLNNNFINCKLSCNHILCIECLLTLVEPICPFCNKNIKKELPENLLKIIQNNLRTKLMV